MGERIAVVGATGYTGGLVVQELLRRGIEVVAMGRDTVRLQALPSAVDRRVIDVADTAAPSDSSSSAHSPSTLVEALDGCRAVINCVGSFAEFGDAVVTAAVAAGVPYVDTSAEFPFLRRVFEVHDGPARTASVALLPGMAFYSAPADLASALAARALGRPPESVDVFYQLTGARPSRGTLRTNLRRAGQPCLAREAGQLVPHRIGDDPRLIRLTDSHTPATVARWPGGEVLTVPRHTGVPSVAVYLGMPKVAAAVLRNPRLTAPLQRVGGILVGHGTSGPSDAARRQARFVIVAEARDADGRAAHCVIEGHDLYGVTAATCAEAVQRLSALAEPLAGALAPAEAFDPADFLDALSGYLTWRVEP